MIPLPPIGNRTINIHRDVALFQKISVHAVLFITTQWDSDGRNFRTNLRTMGFESTKRFRVDNKDYERARPLFHENISTNHNHELRHTASRPPRDWRSPPYIDTIPF